MSYVHGQEEAQFQILTISEDDLSLAGLSTECPLVVPLLLTLLIYYTALFNCPHTGNGSGRMDRFLAEHSHIPSGFCNSQIRAPNSSPKREPTEGY